MGNLLARLYNYYYYGATNSQSNAGSNNGTSLSHEEGSEAKSSTDESRSSNTSSRTSTDSDDCGGTSIRKGDHHHRQPVVLKNPTGRNIHEKYYWIPHRRELGRGGWGVVRVCIDPDSGEELACKSISKRKMLQNDENVECVRREVAILYHLKNCPNVVTIKDTFEDDDQVHIVMELLKGKLLHDAMAEREELDLTYTEEEASNLITAIVQVIKTLHNNGVMHRDIKPDNFMFQSADETSTLKAIDFGLSHFYKPGEPCKLKTFSDYYVAPEVLRGGTHGPKVDIWGAGVLLFVLLSFKYPFWGGNRDGMLRAVARAEVCFNGHPWRNISKNAKDLIKKMLHPDPRERLTAEQVLNDPWLKTSRKHYHMASDADN
ncbi:unnamed protein product [Cuscuta epithymum]|uniref:Protein kinase domain-containing protein n=1 Tax=Cuscuta epithymum TaxID=186058 RepID=A0AAV0CB68_9ASTE|nr:unnamed protein product [Cuscuta epithymum]